MFDTVLKFILLASVTVPNCFNMDVLRVFENKMLFVFSFMLFVGACFSKSQQRIKPSIMKMFAVMLSICLFSLLVHGLNGRVVTYSMNVFFLIIDTYLIIEYAKEPENCFKFIAIGALLNIIIFAGEYIWDINPIYPIRPRDKGISHNVASGLLNNPVRFSMYFAITLPFLFAVSKTIFTAAIVVSLFGYDRPETPCIITIFIMLFFIKNKGLRTAFLLLLLNFFCFIYFWHDFNSTAAYFYNSILTSLQVRFDGWYLYINEFFSDYRYSIFGVGIGSEPTLDKFHDATLCSSHMQFLISTGAIGLIIYFAFIKYYIKNFRNNTESIAILNLFFLSFIEYPIQIIRYWPTISFMFGSYFIKTLKGWYANAEEY